jgi:hypothetical protein
MSAPTPGWVLTVHHSPDGASWDVRSPAGNKLANVADQADARLIVRAVNSHDELLAALSGLATDCAPTREHVFGRLFYGCRFCSGTHPISADQVIHYDDCSWARAQAAIARAAGR